MMNENEAGNTKENRKRLEMAYTGEKPKLLARLRAAGRSIEEAEDMVHDIYAETIARLSILPDIRNLSAWINTMVTRRLIDLWRHEKVRKTAGEIQLAEETLREIIEETGLDPLDEYVRDNIIAALYDAIAALPGKQRQVIEAQVFKGLTFREIAALTGESIDTLTARKRYALQTLSRTLRHWIEQ